MSSTNHRGALAKASIGLAVLLPVCGILHACTSVAVEPEPYALDLSAIPNPMAVGDSVLLTATLYTKSLVVISSAQFVWESSNPSVATVDQQGWVRVKSMGETTISVKSHGFHESSALVTLGEVTGRVLVDGEPAAGLTVRLRVREPMYAVTDQLGEYRFPGVGKHRFVCSESRPSSCYIVEIFGHDILRYGFQDYDKWATIELGKVTEVETFSGFSIPECDTTNSLVELVFVNNDPVYDDFFRAAACRWTSIIRGMNQTPCPLGPPSRGIRITVDYVADSDHIAGTGVLCNGHPWRASIRMYRNDYRDHPEADTWGFNWVTTSVGFALGVLMVKAMPAWSGLVESDSTGAVFTGPNATRAFQALGGVGHPSLRVAFAQARWTGEMYNEVYSWAVRSGSSRPISFVTVGALIDSGYYQVDANQAESYHLRLPSADVSGRAPMGRTLVSPPFRVIDRRTARR